MTDFRISWISVLAFAFAVICGSTVSRAADWPMMGRDGTRNAVSPERRPPTSWDVGKRSETNQRQRIPGSSRNIKWLAPLGSQTHSTPVVSGGLVWIGTNNARPGIPRGGEFDSVLRCFRATDGQPVHEYMSRNQGLLNVHDRG